MTETTSLEAWTIVRKATRKDLELLDDLMGALAIASVRQMLSDVSLGARQYQAAAGTAFYEADMPARVLFFIHDGYVRIYQVGQKPCARLVEILGPGDWFGIPALTGGEYSQYGTRAVAMTAVTVFEVPVDRFLAAVPNHPVVARELLSQLSSKLQCLWTRGNAGC